MKTTLILILCLLILAACSPTNTAYDQSGYASCTGWFCSARVENTVYDGSSLALTLAFVCVLAAIGVAVIAAAASGSNRNREWYDDHR